MPTEILGLRPAAPMARVRVVLVLRRLGLLDLARTRARFEEARGRRLAERRAEWAEYVGAEATRWRDDE